MLGGAKERDGPPQLLAGTKAGGFRSAMKQAHAGTVPVGQCQARAVHEPSTLGTTCRGILC